MCYFRRVRNIYLQCGHTIAEEDEAIICDLVKCKFSPNHPKDCQPPVCSRTCWQYRQYPQQYAPQIDRYCPNCIAPRHSEGVDVPVRAAE